MARGFPLPIKSTYVSHWGVWECCREFIQNAVDEEAQHGNEMVVTYKARLRNLIIENIGADMGKEALLIGETSKEGAKNLRGKFGEGLDLALLVGVRSGLKVMVETQTERWTPVLEKRPEYGDRECLVIQTRKLQKRRGGVRVRLIFPEDIWPSIEKRFLFLKPPPEGSTVETSSGTLINHDDYRGRIYSRGIYVCSIEDMEFGYDFEDLELDRDRRAVQGWELKWRGAQVLAFAARDASEKVAAKLYKMLNDSKGGETEEVSDQIGSGSAALEHIVDEFKLVHGDTAIPCANMAESKQLDHYGDRGVVVGAHLYRILMKHYGSVAERLKKKRFEVTTTYAYSDLSTGQATVLDAASKLLDAAVQAVAPSDDAMTTLANLAVVDFASESILGTCVLGSGEMKLAAHQLESIGKALSTLLHEMAHALTEADDGEHEHIATIEALWLAVFEASREGNRQ